VSWNPQWDAREPLGGAPSALGRQIGVLVGQPFRHVGLNATYVDISRETPRLNTDTWGSCYPVAETERHAREAFDQTIAELDALIAHLTAHRDRLSTDRAGLPSREFGQEPVSRDLSSREPAAPPAVVDVPLPLNLPASDSTPKG
jgi:hypothetical protein